MFGVPGPLGAKLGNFELGGWGAYVCYSLPSPGPGPGARTPHRPNSKFHNLALNGPGTPNIGFLM